MRSVLSQRDMSESTTVSPSCSPSTTLNRIHRSSPDFDGNTNRFMPIGAELEKTDRTVLLPERRPSHVQDVVQTFQVDRAIHTQVGPRSLGKFAR